MTKHEYIDENAKYLGSALAAIEQVPEDKWDAIMAAMQLLGGTDPGIDCEVTITHETLADSDDARDDHWSERGKRSEHTIAGHAALMFERFQVARGRTRQATMVVVDLGDIRVALY